MDRPSVSVIIPCYNYGHLIERAVESSIQQTLPCTEVIVVNDGSTDNSEEVIRRLQNRCSNLKYIYQKNSGVAAARNVGVSAARGDFLVFVDADDELVRDAVESVVDFAAQSPSVKVIVGGHLSVSEKGRERAHTLTNVPKSGFQRFKNYLNKSMPLSNGAVFFHKEVFEVLSYPEDCRSSEDIPVFAHAVALYETSVIDKVLVRVNKHEDSLRHNTAFSSEVGERLVSKVFDSSILPVDFFVLKNQFHAQRCLSLFRSFYLAKEYVKARQYYCKAVIISPLSSLKVSYLRKYLKILFK